MSRSAVYKYRIEIDDDVQTLRLPENAEILTVAMQSLHVALWARVDPDKEPNEERRFLVLSTGESTDELYLKYIGTVFSDSRREVYHVFERLTE